ncbi:MAG: hypothetical protein ACLFM8_00355 [Halobacteriales archaeon]
MVLAPERVVLLALLGLVPPVLYWLDRGDPAILIAAVNVVLITASLVYSMGGAERSASVAA